MPRKGGRKKFSTPEEIEAQRLEIERMSLGDVAENEGEGGLDTEGGKTNNVGSTSAKKEESSDDESSGEEEVRAKGVSHLIAVENPNYVKTKSAKKLTSLDANSAKPVLTRREREEIEAQRLAAEAEEALIKQEMETLAVVRQERERERAKAEAERSAKEAEKAKRAAELQQKMQQKQLNKQNKGRKVNQVKLAEQQKSAFGAATTSKKSKIGAKEKEEKKVEQKLTEDKSSDAGSSASKEPPMISKHCESSGEDSEDGVAFG